jgi:hypothetical protein
MRFGEMFWKLCHTGQPLDMGVKMPVWRFSNRSDYSRNRFVTEGESLVVKS